MSSLAGVALVTATMMLAPPRAPSGLSPGIGYTVSQWQREVDVLASEHEHERTAGHATSPRLAPVLPPPTSDLARVQSSPSAQGLLAAAAIAAQVAMLVAGVVSVRQQNAEARAAQRGRTPPYRPYR